MTARCAAATCGALATRSSFASCDIAAGLARLTTGCCTRIAARGVATGCSVYDNRVGK